MAVLCCWQRWATDRLQPSPAQAPRRLRRPLAAILQAERSGDTFSLLIFDIDHVKAVNDLHGHDTGDIILKRLAKLVGRSLRSTDLLSRWGGEEFTILLHDTSLKGAAVFAERLRQLVADTRLQGLSITISLGITQYLPGDDMEGLYRAKRAGRNTVVAGEKTTNSPGQTHRLRHRQQPRSE
ncbi:GGDEF domain-containing protein [Billgrantia endophytica]|uniref:GGDEF domain-containing protein n=1 Tax=Billgrantia endophytica TaxID=2033802 RepID=UPI001F0C0660|nr:GGDEF domain-containing protein [Halomonas endophytica]